MDSQGNDLEALRALIAELTRRVYRLEQVVASRSVPSPSASQSATPPVVEDLPDVWPAPTQVPSPPVSPGIHIPPQRKHGLSPDATNADLETRIGSHWLNRVGIAALLIGISYFLKFAFDNNWIGPVGRVTIGLLAGVGVVLWSERYRSKGYRFFSWSLKAVGIGALYLSLWAAFQVYALIPSGVAFVAMLGVTAATAAMAISQDAEILAALALSGGFLTPVLLSTGQNRELELFSYVALLDLATLVLVVFKPWPRLLAFSFAGTIALYMGWYSSFYNDDQFRLTLGFATLFFSVFAIAPLGARRAPDETDSNAQFARMRRGTPLVLLVAFVNAVVYFLQLYWMYQPANRAATAWFALALAAVYILLSRRTGVRYGHAAQEALRLLHLALAVGFITIAIPIRLEAHWITIGWLIEAGVLLWVADRIHSDLLNSLAITALVLGIARLILFDNFSVHTLFFNSRFLTYMVAVGVLAVIVWYGGQRGDDTGRNAALLASVAINILLLVALSREVSGYYSRELQSAYQPYARGGVYSPDAYSSARSLTLARDFTFSALWMVYGAVLMAVGFWKRSAFVRWQALILIAATIIKVFVYDVSELDRAYRILSFIVLGVLLLAISFVYQRGWLNVFRSDERSEAGQS